MSPCEIPPGSKKYIFRVLLKLKLILSIKSGDWAVITSHFIKVYVLILVIEK